MVHRAIVGSFERFMAVLIEHFAGKWPFWLSPRQVLVIPVMPTVNDYVAEVHSLLKAQKMNVDVDVSGNTLQKKIRTGQLAQYNFIFGMCDHFIPSQLPTDTTQWWGPKKRSHGLSTFAIEMIRKRNRKGN
jgi:threonyl-tRNA synthetase